MTWLRAHTIGILGFAISLAYWPGMLSAAYVPRWALIALVLPLVCSLDPRSLPPLLRGVLVFLLIAAALSLFLSPDPKGGTLALFYIVILSGVMLLGAELESLDDLMLGMTFGLMPSVALALCQYFDIWSPVPARGPAGLFYNSEVFAEFAALLTVWCCVSRRWALAAITAVPIVLCESRVGAIAAAAAILYGFRPPARWFFPIAVNLVLLAAVAVIGLGPYKFALSYHRLVIWGATLMAVTPFGNGLGWFNAALPVEQFAHSDALQAVAELGVAAAALALIPFLVLIGNRGSYAERALFVAVCIEAAISFPLHVPAGGFLAAAVAGYLVGVRPVVRVGERDRRSENERGLQWRNAAGAIAARAGGFGSLPVSLRPVFARHAPQRAQADRGYSAAGWNG